MKRKKVLQTRLGVLAIAMLVTLGGCYPDESLDVPVREVEVNLDSEVDQRIEEDFRIQYGMAIRYRFVDRFVAPTRRVTPPRLEAVDPMLDFIQEFWINPYLDIDNGEEFFREHVPSEIVLLGGPIFNNDGTITLGTADAGAQITFTNTNEVDPLDDDWRTLQLQTVYHEFAHIIHQRYKLPAAYETISPAGYTSPGSWFNLLDEEALERGFVSPYSTSSPNEDFAETVAFFLFDPDFDENFMPTTEICDTPECEAENLGRQMIEEKLTAICQHYERVVNVDLVQVREAIQARLNNIQ